MKPRTITILGTTLALFFFAGNIAFVDAEALTESQVEPVFDSAYPPVIMKTWLDVPDRVIISSQLDITQWVEVARPLPAEQSLPLSTRVSIRGSFNPLIPLRIILFPWKVTQVL